MSYNEEALRLHAEHHGKIEVVSKVSVQNRAQLSLAYTPGVAEPCRRIAENRDDVYTYTAKGNMVAIVTNGTAVLGLGDIGPEASLPVMEGKAVLFKEFAGVDAYPICLDTKDLEEIIRTVALLAPGFGAVNLEDIASPACFEIERRLEEMLDIPVFHDDQHGTAVVVTAALHNALKLTGRRLEDIKVVLNGPGAAGTAIIKMLHSIGVGHITACDLGGILHKGRADLPQHMRMLCEITNPEGLSGTLADAMQGADVCIGVSAGNVVSPDMVRAMASDPIIFAMANPTPEIMPYDARQAGAAVIGTGRSDYPNQINNVLAYPGIFKGALAVRARDINDAMKAAAAQAIAGLVSPEDLSADCIIPDPFDGRIAQAVADAVANAARETRVARL